MICQLIVLVGQTYVQDLMLKEAKIIYELIALERGHFYVCGDCKMAENVYQTLKSIIQEQTGMNSMQSDNFMMGLRVRIYAHIVFLRSRFYKFIGVAEALENRNMFFVSCRRDTEPLRHKTCRGFCFVYISYIFIMHYFYLALSCKFADSTGSVKTHHKYLYSGGTGASKNA